MTARAILVVGLGPGRWEDLTLAARQALAEAPRILCRTLRHPTVDALRRERPDVVLESFDALYDEAESFADLYPRMAEDLLRRATEAPEPLLYAVPGHPLLGEDSVRHLRARAATAGIEVRIVAGLSFLEPVCAALDLDPLARDLQLLDATTLADVPPSALQGTLLPHRPALVAQVYNRRLASGVKLALGELYPAEWEVALVRWAGLPEERVEWLPLAELDRAERADHLSTLYVPPLPVEAATRVPEGLRAVVARLRAPDGCPWDREQTHQSLRRYVLEEAYEVADVLDAWDGSPELAEQLADELGDLLLQVYLQAEIAEGEDLFHLGDVYEQITTKLIRRHPHVFGEVRVRDSAQVLRNWDEIKRAERTARGADVAAESALRGVPASAPALTQSVEFVRKAAKVGFAWPDAAGALAKVAEELREVTAALAAGTPTEQVAEVGDLLFALAAFARYLGVQPEDALRSANRRFRLRFEAVEARARQAERPLASLTSEEWLAWWSEAKPAR